MANSLKLTFSGLSVQEPYKAPVKLKFFGLSLDTQKQSSLKFWGLSVDNTDPDTILIQMLKQHIIPNDDKTYINWTTLFNLQYDSINHVLLNNNLGVDWNNYALSDPITLSGINDVELVAGVNDVGTNDGYFIGFTSVIPTNVNKYSDFDYGLYWNATKVRVFEKGTMKIEINRVNPLNVSLRVKNNIVEYLMNDSVFYTSDRVTPSQMWICSSIGDMSATITKAYYEKKEISLTDDIVFSYNFDDVATNTILTNEVPNSNFVLTKNNGVSYDIGKIGKSISNLSNTIWATGTSNLSFDNRTSNAPFTFNLWICPNVAISNKFIFTKSNNSTSLEYIFQVWNSTMYFAIGDGVTNWTNSIVVEIPYDDVNLVVNKWSMLTITHDGSYNASRLKIYKDGVLLNTTSKTNGTYNGTTPNINVPFYIGLGNATEVFTGYLDLFSCWRRELAQSEIDILYNQGSGITYPFNKDNAADVFIERAGITDSIQIDAITTLVKDLKDNNLWSKFKAIYPFVGGTADTHKYNLLDPRDLDIANRLTFTNESHSDTGMIRNGNGYADTKFFPSQNSDMNLSNSLSVYTGDDNVDTTSDPILMGIYNSNNSSFLLTGLNSSMNKYIGMRMNSSLFKYNTTSIKGMLIGSRSNNTNLLMHNGSIVLSSDTENGVFSDMNSSVLIGNIRNNGSIYPIGYSNQEFRFASIGYGLTEQEAVKYSEIVEDYQIRLERSVINK